MEDKPLKLQSKGVRRSIQRLAILEEIRKVDTHPTADDVYAMVRHRLPKISLGTVYRNLELLTEGGEIQRLESAGTQRRYDGNPVNHTHIRCTCCGRVEDLHDVELPSIDEIGADIRDYQITGCRLEFTGICPICRTDGRNIEKEKTDG